MSRVRRGRGLLLVVVAGVLVAAGTTIALRGQDRAEPAQPAGSDGARVTEVDLRPPTRQPGLPATASQPTEAGATAFSLFWFDTLNYSLSVLDNDALAAHTGAGCAQCNGWLIAIQRWKQEGATLEGGLSVPVELSVGPFVPEQPVQFAATYLTTPATVSRPGKQVADFPGGRTRGALTVLWANGRWQMTDVVLDVQVQGR